MRKRYFNRKNFLSRRKSIRHNATIAEKHLWNLLKAKRLEGKKFRRQQSIGNYIVDFYCPEEKLIIELDGQFHYNPVNEAYDYKRTKFFLDLGLKVIRFENQELYNNLDMVIESIKCEFTKPPRPVGTPPSKGGE